MCHRIGSEGGALSARFPSRSENRAVKAPMTGVSPEKQPQTGQKSVPMVEFLISTVSAFTRMFVLHVKPHRARISPELLSGSFEYWDSCRLEFAMGAIPEKLPFR